MINPTEYAARGIDGDDYNAEADMVPLKAIWRMVWTTAFDVVSEQVAEFVPGLESLGLTTGGGGDGEDVDAPGYFDVEYLDEELLIIRQQVPGGVFALVKVDSCEP